MGTKCTSAASPGDPLVSFPSLGKKLAAQGRVREKKAPSLAAKLGTLRNGAPSRGPGQLPLGLRAAALRRLSSKCACGRELASAGQFTFARPTTKTKLSRNCRRGRRPRRPAGGASSSPTGIRARFPHPLRLHHAPLPFLVSPKGEGMWTAKGTLVKGGCRRRQAATGGFRSR